MCNEREETIRATVLITTKDRKEELRQAICSCLIQSAPVEVLVIDDGSTDGTQEMMASEFPSIRYLRDHRRRGYIVRRNQGARIAKGEVIFSIDDDAAFSSPFVVEQTLLDFDHPRIGAVAIPFVDVKKNRIVRQRPPENTRAYVTDSYVGTAHAFRRDLFNQLDGYRECLVHQGEERDYCIRLMNAGFVVRLGRADPIHHYESPRREFQRMDYFGRRNDVLFAWQNVPWWCLPIHLSATTIRGIAFGIRLKRPVRMCLGTIAGYGACVRYFFSRSPVSGKTYRLNRIMKKSGPIPLAKVEQLLPPMRVCGAQEMVSEPNGNSVVESIHQAFNSRDPLVTFMIPTRDRVVELDKTLHSCMQQEYPTRELLVVDDSSIGRDVDQIRSRYPKVNLVRFHTNRGSVAARNEIMRRANGKYIIGLDDDSRFIDPQACRKVVERLEAEPDLGIISFQAIGPENPERMTEAGRLRGEWHCSSFAACGVAIRREMLEKTGLFPEFFFHAYEEPDLCLRAWDAGYRVLQWNEIVVYHEFSGLNRNEQRTHRRHARNEACSIWMRHPWHLVLPMTMARLASQCRYAARRGWLWREPRVWAEFLARIPLCLYHRRAVSTRAVKICLALNRARVADPRAVWELGNLSWRQILSRRIPGAADQNERSGEIASPELTTAERC